MFQLGVSNSKVKKQKFNIRVSNSKWNLRFYEVELGTREKNFYKNVLVSNSKYDVILNNLIL